MNANVHSARNGPRRMFVTAIAIAGMIAGLAVSASAPPVNEQVAVPKAGLVVKNDSGQKIGQNTSPGATLVASANQLAKLANANNGVTTVAAVINSTQGFAFNTGASDSTFVATAVTTNMEPIDTSPSATVGRSASANTAQVINTEGGVCSGATLVVNAAADFSVEWTDLGAQATACNA